MSSPIRLLEWESVQVELSREQAAAVRRVAGQRLDVQQSEQPGEVVLRASSWVGALRAGDVEVRIDPKVGYANVFAMLIEADDVPTDLLDEAVSFATTRDLEVALATLFARTAARALRQGLVRAYRDVRERPPAMRGKLDLRGLMRQPAMQVPLACEYQEFDANTDLHRHLLAAAVLARRTPGLAPSARAELRTIQAMLDEHALGVPPAADFLDRRHLSRLEEHYRPSCQLGALLRRGAAVTHRAGAVGAAGILLNMNDLFESFVGRSLQRLAREDVEVALQDSQHLDRDGRVGMIPDIVVRDRRTGAPITVADVKYKLTADGIGRTGDYFQLLAYCTANGLSEGTLIYATTDGSQPPREVVARGTGVRLRTHSVDLTGKTQSIRSAMLRLADELLAPVESVGGQEAMAGVR